MAKELYEAGTTFILVTAYSEQENERLLNVRKNVTDTIDKKYINNVSFYIRKSYKLDSRLNMNGKSGACYAPLTELLICPDGKLRLCCMDIDENEAFGDLHKENFEDIIINNHERLTKLRESLIKSERTLELCKKCNFVNRMKGFYMSKGDFRNNASKLKRK
ncbi:MAG: SPASM domain-containing protein [Novosphingobium sp.]|nr:SPASM domain-containing protein [Novosphingobium sp.]